MSGLNALSRLLGQKSWAKSPDSATELEFFPGGLWESSGSGIHRESQPRAAVPHLLALFEKGRECNNVPTK